MVPSVHRMASQKTGKQRRVVSRRPGHLCTAGVALHVSGVFLELLGMLCGRGVKFVCLE